LRARLDLAARFSAQGNFCDTNAVKCHPEPAAKDLAVALFAAAICLVLVTLRTRVFETASDQANRSARNAPSEILRRWLRMTSLFRPPLLSLWG
jgi:hypothetical protein